MINIISQQMFLAADAHNTSPAVWAAICEIAGNARTAERIWQDPTPDETERVRIVAQQYRVDDESLIWGDAGENW